jgi:hypothetical protein
VVASLLANPNPALGTTSAPAPAATVTPNRVGSGTASTGGLSRSATWLLIGATSLSLALGTLGYALRGARPKRRRKQGGFGLLSKLQQEDPARGLVKAHRLCPSCGLHYRENVRFCGRDGAPLLLISQNH